MDVAALLVEFGRPARKDGEADAGRIGEPV
jgi:hypothetical protein